MQGGGSGEPPWITALNRLIATSPTFIYAALDDYVTLDGFGNVSVANNVMAPATPNDDFIQVTASARLGRPAASTLFPSGCPSFSGDGASYLLNQTAAWIPSFAGSNAYYVASLYYVPPPNGSNAFVPTCRGLFSSNAFQYENLSDSGAVYTYAGVINTGSSSVTNMAGGATWAWRRQVGTGFTAVEVSDGFTNSVAVAGSPTSDMTSIACQVRNNTGGGSPVPAASRFLPAGSEMALSVGWTVLAAADVNEAESAMAQYGGF